MPKFYDTTIAVRAWRSRPPMLTLMSHFIALMPDIITLRGLARFLPEWPTSAGWYKHCRVEPYCKLPRSTTAILSFSHRHSENMMFLREMIRSLQPHSLHAKRRWLYPSAVLPFRIAWLALPLSIEIIWWVRYWLHRIIYLLIWQYSSATTPCRPGFIAISKIWDISLLLMIEALPALVSHLHHCLCYPSNTPPREMLSFTRLCYDAIMHTLRRRSNLFITDAGGRPRADFLLPTSTSTYAW